VELAESCAELLHRRIRSELNLTPERGKRYSPGFPSWDDLADQRKIFALLQPGEIGLTLTSSDELDPVESVTALVVHHPQAEYF
jgi:5-methyltetrahydrofolate--homocysteine methyltransferase